VRREILRLLRAQPLLAWIVGGLALAGVFVAVALSGGEDDEPARAPAPAGSQAAQPAARSFLRRLIPAPATGLPGARVPGVIRRLVARMPAERKAAQLMLVGFEGRDTTISFFRELKRTDMGGVVFERRNYIDPVQLLAMTTSVVNATARKGHEPPLILARQSGGELSTFPDLPPAAEPGELAGIKDAANEYAEAATALREAGLNGVLGPPVNVGAHEADALGTRAFGDDPAQVAEFGKAAVAAFRRARMLVAPEHFPGIGAATEDTDRSPAQVGLSVEELQRRDLIPFRAAIAAGAPAVVVSHATYAPDDFVVPGSLSAEVIGKLLRGGLGFRGLAISDDLSAGAITSTQPSTADAAVAAVAAGIDMVWISGGQAQIRKAYRALVAAIKGGKLARARVDTAVTRILTVKRELGLRVRRREAPPQYPGAANPGTGAAPPAQTGAPAPAPPAQPTGPPAAQ
jgi:beta-N-acetylhexosaminidase